MKIYKILSTLLCYPEPELVAAVPELRAALAEYPLFVAPLWPILDDLECSDLIDLQEKYVQTFDRSPAHSLHLFEHIHGEDRARGQAMVDLLEEYRSHGFDLCTDELPDYVPLFLEFLSTLDAPVSRALLGDAIDVLAHVGNKLSRSGSVFEGVFAVLQDLSPVAPKPLTQPPIRDMDEALETFGTGMDGVEPLLKPAMGMGSAGVMPINFYAKRP